MVQKLPEAALEHRPGAGIVQQLPHGDFLMEKIAIKKALENFDALGMEGLLLMDGDTPIAMTMGSPLTEDSFDIHFEKALDIADGA